MSIPSDHTPEPADLSELTATDALLDRLGARAASEDDLRDPTAAALAEMLAMIDETREPDVGAARLMEVLNGRPLYIAGLEAASDEDRASRVIDLTNHDEHDGHDGHDDADRQRTGSSITHLPAPAHDRDEEPAAVGARRWERALGHALLPAASVVALLAIGGGVSAAVTGDPMTPVNGITRVVAQLPGVDDGKDKVQGEIRAAKQAVRAQDTSTATMHLQKARAGLDDVPGSDQAHLEQQISEVETGLVPTPTPVPSAAGKPDTTTKPAATAKPTPDPDPTPSVTVAPPAPSLTPEPDPTLEPTAPADPPPTTSTAVQPTPGAAPSSP